MKRGEVRWYKFAQPDKKRPVLILSRSSVIEYLGEVTIAAIKHHPRHPIGGGTLGGRWYATRVRSELRPPADSFEGKDRPTDHVPLRRKTQSSRTGRPFCPRSVMSSRRDVARSLGPSPANVSSDPAGPDCPTMTELAQQPEAALFVTRRQLQVWSPADPRPQTPSAWRPTTSRADRGRGRGSRMGGRL
jgi:hypothetical protein